MFFLPSVPPFAHEPNSTITAAKVPNPSQTPPDPQPKREQGARPAVQPMRPIIHPAAPVADERRTKIAADGVQGRPSAPPDPQTRPEQALRLHAKGMEQIGQGNVLAARSFFTLAARAGLRQSMRALAGTYDPVELEKLKVLGMQPDVDAA